jgi:hypothetical protein
MQSMARVLRNMVMRTVGRADYARWSSPQGLEEWWDERTKVLAGLVPAGSIVIEFGAGRRQLEKLLPADCTYTPSDLVERGPGTLVCDLNRRPLPSLSHLAPDVAVFGGVLEYIRDLAGVAAWLAASDVKTCILSFDPVPAGTGRVGLYRELNRRAYFGYMNNLTEKELLYSFDLAGYVCIQRQTWTRQIIFKFTRTRRSIHSGSPSRH